MSNLIIFKEGGLFDFDLTLPAIMFEFLILSFFLDKILYQPIFQTIDTRKSYINNLSNEINLLVAKGEILLTKYETIIATENLNLTKDNLNYNQTCDKIFEHFITNLSDWNIQEIQRSKSILTYQLNSIFKSVKTILQITEEQIYKSFI